MTDPLKLAAEMTSGNPWTGPDKPSLMRFSEREIALCAAALRLASTVDRAETRRRERTGVEHHGLDRDEAEMLDAYRKARGA